jgi:hypothetical protein
VWLIKLLQEGICFRCFAHQQQRDNPFSDELAQVFCFFGVMPGLDLALSSITLVVVKT